MSNQNANTDDIAMNASPQPDMKVLIMTTHVQATLGIVLHIVGPKEEWDPWMHKHLESEHVSTLGLDEDKHRLIMDMFLEPDTKH